VCRVIVDGVFQVAVAHGGGAVDALGGWLEVVKEVAQCACAGQGLGGPRESLKLDGDHAVGVIDIVQVTPDIALVGDVAPGVVDDFGRAGADRSAQDGGGGEAVQAVVAEALRGADTWAVVAAAHQVAQRVVAVALIKDVACSLPVQGGGFACQSLGLGVKGVDRGDVVAGGDVVAAAVLGDLALGVHGHDAVAERLGEACCATSNPPDTVSPYQ
jgi:hypothetical protein